MAGCALGSLAQEMSSQDPVLRKKLGEVFERHVGKFERVIAEAVGRGDLPRLDAPPGRPFPDRAAPGGGAARQDLGRRGTAGRP